MTAERIFPGIRKKYFKLKERRPPNGADILHKTDKCGIIESNYTFVLSLMLKQNRRLGRVL